MKRTAMCDKRADYASHMPNSNEIPPIQPFSAPLEVLAAPQGAVPPTLETTGLNLSNKACKNSLMENLLQFIEPFNQLKYLSIEGSG